MTLGINDEGQDEFFVDNIAFDGNNIYTRGDPVTGVAQLGSFAVYEGAETTEDPVTGTTLRTFTYRAIYGRSTTGETEFAIVRSGSYVDYGFGGFVYQRNGFDDDGNEVRLVLPDFCPTMATPVTPATTQAFACSPVAAALNMWKATRK